MERGPALAPELRNEGAEAARGQYRREAERADEPRRGLVRWFFDRGTEGGKAPAGKRLVISAPSAPQKAYSPGFPYAQQVGPAPPRPVRPPVELAPDTPELQALREAKAMQQKIPRKPVAVRKENLGTAASAFRSNPVDGADLARARKVHNRKTAFVAVSPGGDGAGIVEMHPGRSARHTKESLGLPESSSESEVESTESESEKEKELEMGMGQSAPVRRRVQNGDAARLSRRRGMVVDPQAMAPLPQHPAKEQKAEPQPIPQPRPQPQGVPELVLTPPRDPTPPPIPKVGHLTTDYPYKRLLKQAQRKAEAVAREFEPLAQALCTAGGLGNVEDVHPEDLLSVLEQVIEDAEGLADARELVFDLLADDAHLEGSARSNPVILREVLRKALGTRDEAIHAATHHKRRAKELKARVAELEAEASQRGSEEESGAEIARAL